MKHDPLRSMNSAQLAALVMAIANPPTTDVTASTLGYEVLHPRPRHEYDQEAATRIREDRARRKAESFAKRQPRTR